MRINFEGVSTSFEPVPTDTYDCVFTKGTIVAESKTSGKPYVQMEYTIEDGDYSGRKFWVNRSLQPQALFAIKRDLLCLGAPESVLEGEVDLEEVLDSVEGSSARLKVRESTYEGKPTNEVMEVLAPEHAF